MSEPTAQPANAEPTPSGSPSTPPTGAAEPQVWRAGPTADPRLQGKTAEEILGIAGALLTVAEKFNQPTPQPTQPQPSRFDLDLKDDDYMTGADVKRVIQKIAANPPVDPVARQQNIALAVDRLKSKYPKDFERWSGEIYQEWNKLHPDYITLDTLETCVKLIRSNHVDELAAEKAQQLANDTHPTIRSGSGGSGSGPLATELSFDSDQMPQDWVQKARSLGITEREIAEWCQQTGQTREQFMKSLVQFGKGAYIRG